MQCNKRKFPFALSDLIPNQVEEPLHHLWVQTSEHATMMEMASDSAICENNDGRRPLPPRLSLIWTLPKARFGGALTMAVRRQTCLDAAAAAFERGREGGRGIPESANGLRTEGQSWGGAERAAASKTF